MPRWSDFCKERRQALTLSHAYSLALKSAFPDKSILWLTDRAISARATLFQTTVEINKCNLSHGFRDTFYGVTQNASKFKPFSLQ